MGLWTDYAWIVAAGSLAAFFTAFGIGANDVANAFGSSVAARTLTMRQALVIASVCEFSGSVLLGAQVTRTVAGGIARLTLFDTEPEIYMYGMLCALVASGTWLLLATYLSLPVSTTHATIGGVLGFAFVYGGPRAVVWLEPQDTFPYMGGLVPIILAWFSSPLVSGLATVVLFVAVRFTILRRVRSLQLAIWSLPLLVLFTVFINLFFVLDTGAGSRLTWPSRKCVWLSAAAAAGCAALTALAGVPFMQHRMEAAALARCQQSSERTTDPPDALRPSTPGTPAANASGTGPRLSYALTEGSLGGGRGATAAAERPPSVSGSRGTPAATAADTRGQTGPGPFQSQCQGRGGPGPGGGTHGYFVSARSFSHSTVRPSGASQASRQGRGPLDVTRPPQPPPPIRQQQQSQASQQQQQQQVYRRSMPLASFPETERGAEGEAEAERAPGTSTPGIDDSAGCFTDTVTGVQPGPAPPPSPTTQQQQQCQRLRSRRSRESEPSPPRLVSEDGQRAPPAPPELEDGQQQAQGEQGGVGQREEAAELLAQSLKAEHAGALDPAGAGAGGGGGASGLLDGAQWISVGPAAAAEQQQQQQPQWLVQQQQQWQLGWQQQQYPQGQELRGGTAGWQLLQHPGLMCPQYQGQGQYYSPVSQHWQQQGASWQQHQLLWQQMRAQMQMQQQEQRPMQARQEHHQQEQQQQHWQHHQRQALGQKLGAAAASAGCSDIAALAAQGPQQWLWRQRVQAPGLLVLRRGDDPTHAGRPLGPVAEGVEAEFLGPLRGRKSRDRRGEYGNRSGAPAGGGSPLNSATAVAAAAGAAGNSETSGSSTTEGEQPQQPTQQQQYASHPLKRTSNNVQFQKTFDQLKAIVLHGTNVNVHDCVEAGTDAVAVAIHAHAEVFDPSTEHAFKYLQVVTAVCDSFSHGANDVANSVGPLAAIVYIYRYQRVDVDSPVPVWVLLLGGAGIVIGLAVYGYNIICAIGVRFSALTPSRGFCIELSTALVVVLASKYGLPISTTHCQVGATAGMGLLEGSAGINWPLAAQFFTGWLVTLLFTALLSAGLFAAGSYAPCIQQARAIGLYREQLAALATRLDLLLNRTNTAALLDPATWGNHSGPLAQQLAVDLAALQLATTHGSADATRRVQYVPARHVVEFVTRTLELYVNNSLPYIGGMQAQGRALPRWP